MEIKRRAFLRLAGLAGIPLGKKPETPTPPQYNPHHNSLQMARLNRIRESVYAEEWKRRNERRAGVNHGFTILEWILAPKGDWPIIPISDRDAEVAACIIQWLGTSCGYHFTLECEAKIKKAEQSPERMKC